MDSSVHWPIRWRRADDGVGQRSRSGPCADRPGGGRCRTGCGGAGRGLGQPGEGVRHRLEVGLVVFNNATDLEGWSGSCPRPWQCQIIITSHKLEPAGLNEPVTAVCSTRPRRWRSWPGAPADPTSPEPANWPKSWGPPTGPGPPGPRGSARTWASRPPPCTAGCASSAPGLARRARGRWLVKERARATALHLDLGSATGFGLPLALKLGLSFALDPCGVSSVGLPFGFLCRDALRGLACPR